MDTSWTNIVGGGRLMDSRGRDARIQEEDVSRCQSWCREYSCASTVNKSTSHIEKWPVWLCKLS
jgi:hypothetical protein